MQEKLDFAAWHGASTDVRECCVFTIGKAILERANHLPDLLLRRIRWATVEAARRVRTNNYVERSNRVFRFLEKMRYK